MATLPLQEVAVQGGAVVLLPLLSEAAVPPRWEAGRPALQPQEEEEEREGEEVAAGGSWHQQYSTSLKCRSPLCCTLAVVACHPEEGQSQAHN